MKWLVAGLFVVLTASMIWNISLLLSGKPVTEDRLREYLDEQNEILLEDSDRTLEAVDSMITNSRKYDEEIIRDSVVVNSATLPAKRAMLREYLESRSR